MEIIYFDVSHATRAHDYIIETTGGLAGFKSPGNLDSLLYFISHDLYYPTFEEKVSHLFFGLTKFHIFNDGNKRSAISLSIYFLNINGYDYCTSNFIEVMENYVVWVADNKIGKELLLEIITSLINDVSLSNCIKLKVINALNDDQEK